MYKPILRALPLAAVLSSATVTRAYAHAFKSGTDLYEQFVEGGSVIVIYPEVLLPLCAAGILVGLWHADGMVRSWPVFALGLILGVPSAVLVGPWIALWLIGLGLLTAFLAALLSRHGKAQCLILAFLTGLVSIMSSLEGHALFELPVFIYLGILFVANIAFVASANLTRMTIDRFQFAAVPIIFRVAASWIATILLLFLAFELRG